MKSISFDELISFDTLFSAHQRARQCKQHKSEVIKFETALSQNLWALHYDLRYKRYTTGAYRIFTIYDPKEREIQAIPYRDRIVQHALCDNVLIPVLEKRLISANCACRRLKGTDYAIKLLKTFMTKHYKKQGSSGYFIKLDIKKYFPSIDHSRLLSKLNSIFFDEGIRWLLSTIVNSFGDGKGLPMGNQSSQCFALLYLDRVDRFIKEVLRVKFYVRYMDDMILLVETKQQAQNYFSQIANLIEQDLLAVNPKSAIISVKNGIEFLGWRFRFSTTGQIIQKIKKQSKQRIFKKAKHKRYLHTRRKLTTDDLLQSLGSYHGHFSRGNAHKLEQRLAKILG